MQAVREHDRLWLEDGPRDLAGPVEWGGWRIDIKSRFRAFWMVTVATLALLARWRMTARERYPTTATLSRFVASRVPLSEEAAAAL